MSFGALNFLPSGLAFFAAYWITRLLLRPDSCLSSLDQPNSRSLHVVPTPTGGGVAIVVAILFGGGAIACLLPTWILLWIAIPTLVIAVTSFIDDHRPLSALLRIGVHFAAAGALISGGLGLSELELPGLSWSLSPWVGACCSAVFIVWMTNLYNFMDGMDGFAGGMSTIGFGTFAVLGYCVSDPVFCAISLIIAVSSAGFLIFNFPPARIFMGDVGSSTLGLLAAALMLWASAQQLFPIWLGVLVFSPFIVDATVTLVWRAFRGECVWEAHRHHFYQRLVQSGWSHRQTVLCEYGLMVACSGGALAAFTQSVREQWMLLSGVGLAYTGLIIAVSCFGVLQSGRAKE